MTQPVDTTSEGNPAHAPVNSIDRALLILEGLGTAGPQGVTLRALSSELGFSKPSVHRALQALLFRGFATQSEPGGAYVLGSAALGLAKGFSSEVDSVLLLRPTLATISEHAHELVHLGVLEGTYIRYLDKVEPERTLRVWSRVGRTVPAARTALGRAILAANRADQSSLAVYLDSANSIPPVETGGSPQAQKVSISEEALLTALKDYRHRGFAEEVQVNEPGVSCVAVALGLPDGNTLAISVTGPSSRLTEKRRKEVADILRLDVDNCAPQGFVIK